MEWVSPCASERSSQSRTALRGVVETPENMAGFSRTPLAAITPGEREKWRESLTTVNWKTWKKSSLGLRFEKKIPSR